VSTKAAGPKAPNFNEHKAAGPKAPNFNEHKAAGPKAPNFNEYAMDSTSYNLDNFMNIYDILTS
jgi:hypothetical protein